MEIKKYKLLDQPLQSDYQDNTECLSEYYFLAHKWDPLTSHKPDHHWRINFDKPENWMLIIFQR